MDERNRVGRFNRELDTILRGRSPAMLGFSDEEKRSLDLARRFARMDWSVQSRVRQGLRQRLGLQARCNLPCREIFPLGRTASLAVLLVTLLVLLGWMSTGMPRPTSGYEDANVTAYRLPGSGMSPTANVQMLAPTPISIPLAPRVSPASLPAGGKQQSTPPNLSTLYTPSSSAVLTP